MTTTLIYEPIASISDDYFRWPEASGSESSRDHPGDQGLVQTRRLALNITDGNAIQPDCNAPEANRSTLSGHTGVTLPVYHDDDRQFGRGDTVRGHDNDDQCVVLRRWGDWLWLNPISYRNAAPFTAHNYDYYIVKSAEPQQWPNR
jgi:hypothetical protein